MFMEQALMGAASDATESGRAMALSVLSLGLLYQIVWIISGFKERERHEENCKRERGDKK
jgi:hypothetical protein